MCNQNMHPVIHWSMSPGVNLQEEEKTAEGKRNPNAQHIYGLKRHGSVCGSAPHLQVSFGAFFLATFRQAATSCVSHFSQPPPKKKNKNLVFRRFRFSSNHCHPCPPVRNGTEVSAQLVLPEAVAWDLGSVHPKTRLELPKPRAFDGNANFLLLLAP